MARRDAGMTQEQLAERCGVTVETISRLERGKQVPSLARLVVVAESLGTGLPALLEETKREDRRSKAVRRLVAVVAERSADEIEMVADVARRLFLNLDRLRSDRSSRATRPSGSPPPRSARGRARPLRRPGGSTPPES